VLDRGKGYMAVGQQLRHLIVSILCDCTPSRTRELWDLFWPHICDDWKHQLQQQDIERIHLMHRYRTMAFTLLTSFSLTLGGGFRSGTACLRLWRTGALSWAITLSWSRWTMTLKHRMQLQEIALPS
jgi:hypothetical protein